MDKNKNLLLIVPAFNEEKNLIPLWDNFKKSGIDANMVIINDCSTDKTRQTAEKTGATVINLPVNLGIGGAVQTGYLYASQNNYDMAIQVDGDGQHEPKEIAKLVKAMQKSGANMVIGSRFVEKTDYRGSFSRRLGIATLAIATKLIAGQTVKDSTSGFRLVDKKVIDIFANSYPSDYPEPEVLVVLRKNKLKIIEVPVKMNARAEGKSSITSLKSVYYMLKVIFAMVISRIRKV